MAGLVTAEGSSMFSTRKPFSKSKMPCVEWKSLWTVLVSATGLDETTHNSQSHTNIDQIPIVHNTADELPAGASRGVAVSPVGPEAESFVFPG